eukprot:TRINITY_DN539_c1_g1_i2.p1 TRINITY_DN539_c1_g1~~TRINITY_DN539_c1_g1_i2.p1  ORF type:complete len:772 (+),score=138.52 TRINITY_DN539_c1_g1_i2:166-2316(+)
MAKRKAIIEDFTTAQKLYKSHPHITDINLYEETLFITFNSDGYTREYSASLENYPETCTLFSDKTEVKLQCTIPHIVKKIEDDCLLELAQKAENECSSGGGSLRNSWRNQSTESYGEENWVEDEEESEDENKYLANKKLMSDVSEFRKLYSADAITLRGVPILETVYVELLLYPYSVLSRVTAEAWSLSYLSPIYINITFSDTHYTDTMKASNVEVYQKDPVKKKKGAAAQLEYIISRFVQEQWPMREAINNTKTTQSSEKRSKQNLPSAQKNPKIANLSNINSIVEMGFSREIARLALERTSSLDEAMTLLLEDPESLLLTSKLEETTTEQTKVPLNLFQDPSAATRVEENHGVTLNENHGFLVKIFDYAMKRMATLNNYCVICDKPHVFASGSMLKPSVCSRDLCCFSFQQLGVCSNAADGIATEAEVIDLLMSMATVAAKHQRCLDIFDPYPLVFDAHQNPILTPSKKDFRLLTKILDSFPSVEKMTQAEDFNHLKTQLDSAHSLAFPLLQWIITSNRSHIVRIPEAKHLKSMSTPHQFILMSAPPEKEEKFRILKQKFGSVFAFHGSPIENWHCILRLGLKNFSGTKNQLNGAAYGAGIYLSPNASTSLGYTFRTMNQHPRTKSKDNSKPIQNCSNKFLDSNRINCIALCEVINKGIKRNATIWVQPEEDNVVTRFFFVYMGTSDQSASACSTEAAPFKKEIDHAMELLLSK